MVLLINALFLAGAQICPAQTKTADKPKLQNENFAAVRETLQKFVAENAAPGVSLIVLHHGKVIFREAFGNLLAEQKAFIASTTKPFTAAAVLTVVDEGKLKLDDTVGKYLPEFKGTKVENATVRQLLSHTGGFSADYPDGRPKKGTLAEFSRSIALRGSLSEPGKFNYSGVGMDIAARVAEAAAGKNFEDIIKSRIFEPLGLKNTTYRLAADPASVPAGAGRYVSGGGGLDSTLDDVAAFFQMLANKGEYNGKRILSRQIIDEMTRKESVPLNNSVVFGAGYGLGMSLFRLQPNGEFLTFGHAGAFGTIGWVDRERSLTAVFFTQIPLNRAAVLINTVQEKVREAVPPTNNNNQKQRTN